MPEQLSLFGFEDGAKATDNLFFAILPDADAGLRMAQLARDLRGEHGLTGAPFETERSHMSLYGLGSYAGVPRGIIAAAGEAAAAVTVAPFDIVLDRVESFRGGRGGRPLILRGGDDLALKAFHQALGIAMTTAGLGRWTRSSFTPHVTLLYDRRGVAEQIIEPIGWTAREFVLVHSLLGQTRHIALARWPLLG